MGAVASRWRRKPTPAQRMAWPLVAAAGGVVVGTLLLFVVGFYGAMSHHSSLAPYMNAALVPRPRIGIPPGALAEEVAWLWAEPFAWAIFAVAAPSIRRRRWMPAIVLVLLAIGVAAGLALQGGALDSEDGFFANLGCLVIPIVWAFYFALIPLLPIRQAFAAVAVVILLRLLPLFLLLPRMGRVDGEGESFYVCYGLLPAVACLAIAISLRRPKPKADSGA